MLCYTSQTYAETIAMACETVLSFLTELGTRSPRQAEQVRRIFSMAPSLLHNDGSCIAL